MEKYLQLHAQKIKQEQHIQKLFLDFYQAEAVALEAVPSEEATHSKIVCIWRLPRAGISKK
jgi:hypothetical protein